MKKLVVVSILLTGICFSQDASNFVVLGMSYQPGGNPQLAGSGLYAKKLSEDTWGFAVLDAIPATVNPFVVMNQIGVGVAKRVFFLKIGEKFIPVYVPTNAGISWTGENVGWAWSTGTLASVKVKEQFYVTPHFRVVKSSINNNSGTNGFQFIVGVGLGYSW